MVICLYEHILFYFFFIFFVFRSKSTKTYIGCAQRRFGVRSIRNMHLPKKNKFNKRSIKNSLNHYFSGFWSESLNLIEDTWQTQHKRSGTYVTYAAYNFMRKVLWPKNRQGKTKYSVKDTQKNADQTQTKKSAFQKGKRILKRTPNALMETWGN